MKSDLAVEITAFVIIGALTIIASIGLRALDIIPSNNSTIIATCLLALAILFLMFRKRITSAILRSAFHLLTRTAKNDIGLVNIYKNFNEAAPKIQKEFATAKKVRIFIQLGRGVIGGDRSLLFEAARHRKGREFEMHLLYASMDSEFLSRERAGLRKSNYREWTSDIQYTEGSIEALLDDGINISARRHCQPYLWRLFFFDDRLFFMPYFYSRSNSQRAPVLELQAHPSGEGSLYSTLSEYFDYIWHKQEGQAFTARSGAPASFTK